MADQRIDSDDEDRIKRETPTNMTSKQNNVTFE